MEINYELEGKGINGYPTKIVQTPKGPKERYTTYDKIPGREHTDSVGNSYKIVPTPLGPKIIDKI